MESGTYDRDGSLSAYSPASAIQSWLDETEHGGWAHLAPSSTAAADISTNGSVASTALQDMQDFQQHAWQGLAPPAASSAERSSYYAETQSEMFGVHPPEEVRTVVVCCQPVATAVQASVALAQASHAGLLLTTVQQPAC